MKLEKITSLLEGTQLGEWLKEDDIRQIVRQDGPQQVLAGETVMKEGEICPFMIVLLEGKAEVIRRSPDSGEQCLAMLRPCAVIGGAGLFGDFTRWSTVRASEDCTFLRLHRDSLQTWLRRGDSTATRIAMAAGRMLASRITEKDLHLGQLLADHEAALDVVEALLSDTAVRQQLFASDSPEQKREELQAFKEKLFRDWNF
jgi:CRP-like cAMP-binding protein